MTNKLKINLFNDVKQIIDDSCLHLAKTVESTLTEMYWQIGKTINNEILKNERGEYGKQVLSSLSMELTREYGKGFERKNLSRMIQFYNKFSDYQIVATLWRQLTWSHFKLLRLSNRS